MMFQPMGKCLEHHIFAKSPNKVCITPRRTRARREMMLL